MPTYRMSDNTIVRTENSTHAWDEERDHDGHNFIGRVSGTQWDYQYVGVWHTQPRAEREGSF